MRGYGINEINNKLLELSENCEAYQTYGLKINDFLVAVKQGNGNTFIMRYITDYLMKYELRKFNSKEYCLEYTLDGTYKQMSAVFKEIKSSSVYSNDFEGVVALEVSAFAERMNEIQYEALVQEIKGIAEYATVICYVDIDKCAKAKLLFEKLGACLESFDSYIIPEYIPEDLARMVYMELVEMEIDIEDEELLVVVAERMIKEMNIELARDITKVINRLVRIADYSGFIPCITAENMKQVINHSLAS